MLDISDRLLIRSLKGLVNQTVEDYTVFTDMLHPKGACRHVYIWRYYLGLVYLEFGGEGPLTGTVVYLALTLRYQLEENLSYHP